MVERALVRPVRPFKVKVSLLIERGRTRSRSTSSTTHHFHRGLFVPFRAPTFSVRTLIGLPTRNNAPLLIVAYASTQIVTRVHHESQSGVTDLLQVRQVSYHSLVSSNIMRTRKDEDDRRELNQ